jgi:hypothetical protein
MYDTDTKYLLEACQDGDPGMVNRLLKDGYLPDEKCLEEVCKHAGTLKGVFYAIIREDIDPTPRCLLNLCKNIKHSNVANTLLCIKKILKMGVAPEHECIKYLINADIENDDFVVIIMEMLDLLGEKLSIEDVKKLLVKRNVLYRLISYIDAVDVDCYNLLIRNSVTLKKNVFTKFVGMGLKVDYDMFKDACKNRYNGNIIEYILRTNKDIKPDMECFKLICSNPGNGNAIIKILESCENDQGINLKINDELFKLICKYGNTPTIKTLLRKGIKPTYNCLFELCSRPYEHLIIDIINKYKIKPDKACLDKVVHWCKNEFDLIDIIMDHGIVPDYNSFNSNDEDVQKMLINETDKNYKLLLQAYDDKNLLKGIRNFKLLLDCGVCPKYKLVRNICKTHRNVVFINYLIDYREQLDIKFNINCLRYLCNIQLNDHNICRLIEMGIKPDYKCLESACNIPNNDLVILQLLDANITEEMKILFKDEEFFIIDVIDEGVKPTLVTLKNACSKKNNRLSILEMIKTVKPDIECLKLVNKNNFDVRIVKRMITLL